MHCVERGGGGGELVPPDKGEDAAIGGALRRSHLVGHPAVHPRPTVDDDRSGGRGRRLHTVRRCGRRKGGDARRNDGELFHHQAISVANSRRSAQASAFMRGCRIRKWGAKVATAESGLPPKIGSASCRESMCKYV